MLAVPKFTPTTCGFVAGVVCPAATTTPEGLTLTFEISLLDSVTVTPPDGAGVGKVTGKGVESPGPTVIFDCRPIVPALSTVTAAVASAMSGRALAWMVVVPGVAPVTR